MNDRFMFISNIDREKNFPPLPKCCPIGPCFYQDISIEIPGEFQIWVRYLFYVWSGM